MTASVKPVLPILADIIAKSPTGELTPAFFGQSTTARPMRLLHSCALKAVIRFSSQSLIYNTQRRFWRRNPTISQENPCHAFFDFDANLRRLAAF
jgi:hypothetical protein